MPGRCHLVALLLTLGPHWLLSPPAAAADDASLEFFEKQVRPVLAARCYECHSGKLAEPKGSLRVDSRAALLQGGDTGPAIVPGKPGESLLIDAINHGEIYQMPPKSKLPADEIAALTRWVEAGAPWPDEQPMTTATASSSAFDLAQRRAEHWCWRPLASPSIPAANSGSPNPIDTFLASKLRTAGLSPAPRADNRTLLRRAYFDLIGLPPTPEELEAFLADCSSDEKQAFEAIVDELLASPHFGEQWGRHWLDLVRYAESRGHEFDYNIPNAREYRDYVIRALNADVPYDRFLIEHVAGDLLPEPRLHETQRFNESILATGFWFLGEGIHSPVDIRKDECDRVDNMLDVFSKTFLGLTVACARCHDHKFDAISQADYYALSGYLQSSSYRLTRFETWEQDRRIAAELRSLRAAYRPQLLGAAKAALEPKLDGLAKTLAADFESLRTELGVDSSNLRGAEVIVDFAALPAEQWMTDGPTFGDGPAQAGQVLIHADGDAPLEVATAAAARRDWAWGDLEASAASEGEVGRLAGWVRAGRTLKTPTWTLQSGKVHYLIEGAGHVYAAVDSHSIINGPLHNELAKDTGGDSDLPRRWITHDLSRYVGHRVHLEFSPKAGEDFRVFQIVEGERPEAPKRRANALLDQASRTREVLETTLDLLSRDAISESDNAADHAAIANWLLEQAELPSDLVERYRADHERLTGQIARQSRLSLSMWQGTPVDENLLIRGNAKTIGPVIPRRNLEALRGAGVSPAQSRLDLARQLVDPSNPLVSRVLVNRVWHHLFGRGIVPSTDNFGVLGEEPTHPELLDHLAVQFIADGWSLKRLIRSIVLSDAYQQSSGAGLQPAQSADPQNLLFHRQNLKRLEGETIRDALLAISGRLERTQFGPSVPIHLTAFMQGRGRPSESGPLDGAGRRSIYVATRRNFLSPMMLAFDTPIPSTTIGRRNVSNVPAQALMLMNDPFVVGETRRWAERVLAGPATLAEDRIGRMYLAAFSRPPTADEGAAALAFLRQQAAEYGLSADAGQHDPRPWTDLAHVLVNVKEFVLVQ